MADIGNPAGFDIATVLTGSGLTLLLSGAIIRYGDRFELTQAELFGISGAAIAIVGVAFGLVLVAANLR